MSEFYVLMPLLGSIQITVQAETAEEAKREALDVDWSGVFVPFDKMPPNIELGDEFETPNAVTTGNVCHAPFHDTVVFDAEFNEVD